MIDDLEQVERLMNRLEDALPLRARATPQLLATLRKGSAAPGHAAPAGVVRGLHYLGDDGGIMCDMAFDADSTNVVITSITHLVFDPRLQITREIAAYQKRRTKRLRRQHALEAVSPY